jgi:hypothetical protein
MGMRREKVGSAQERKMKESKRCKKYHNAN